MDNEVKTVSIRLKMINEIIEKTANQNLKQHGITISQMRILMMLGCTENQFCSMKKLEESLHLSQQNTVGLVKRMEEKQLLETYVDLKDRRKKNVQITEKGNLLLEKVKKEGESIDTWIAENLTEQEKKDFLKLLEKIYEHVKNANEIWTEEMR